MNTAQQFDMFYVQEFLLGFCEGDRGFSFGNIQRQGIFHDYVLVGGEGSVGDRAMIPIHRRNHHQIYIRPLDQILPRVAGDRVVGLAKCLGTL